MSIRSMLFGVLALVAHGSLSKAVAAEIGPGGAGTPDGPIVCPLDQKPFNPTNPDFLGLVGNELQIAVAREANLAYLAQKYVQAGTGHVRVMLDWREIEPQRGRLDWGYTDLRVSAIANAGIRTLGILGNNPLWAVSCNEPPVPQRWELCAVENLNDYRSFVREAVRHFGPQGTGQIRDWEIRIEANSVGDSGFTMAQYVEELNAAYQVIHDEDPSARVWAPEVLFRRLTLENGTAYEWVDYVILNGNYDVFSIHHLYTLASAHEHTAAVRQRLDNAGQAGTPLAVTAMNIPVSPGSPIKTEEDQARDLGDLYACVSSAGAEYAMWFAGTQWPDLNDTVNGIFAYDFTVPDFVRPRQAYGKLQKLGNVMGPLPGPAPHASLGASTNPCRTSGATCTLELYVYSTNLARPHVQVMHNGTLLFCEDANRAWIKPLQLSVLEAPRTLRLHPAGACSLGAPIDPPIAELTVSALHVTPPAAGVPPPE